ncbi:conserved hypothetical protein [Ricinus communis]|uniref:Uncharacterized protein n=1 Tax=Ricinus communis TaxID=3988 RepID=B9SB88_RICCO|nr:conserved hypothetical protein [Ricinus communis]
MGLGIRKVHTFKKIKKLDSQIKVVQSVMKWLVGELLEVGEFIEQDAVGQGTL